VALLEFNHAIVSPERGFLQAATESNAQHPSGRTQRTDIRRRAEKTKRDFEKQNEIDGSTSRFCASGEKAAEMIETQILLDAGP
jgi:hypothetical protein